jgi:superfamily II DNA or RNA helicase
MRLYSKADIQRECDEGDFRRGLGYFRKGMVLKAQIPADGRVVTGKVRGSYVSSYEQHIDISPTGRFVDISGSCSCPVGYNCKHVVAVLLQGLQEPQKPAPVSAALPAATLRPEVKSWLEALEKMAAAPESDPNAYPEDIQQRLVYVLDPSDLRGTPGSGPAAMKVYSTRLLKAGGYSSRVSIYAPDTALTCRHARYLRPVDMEILRNLHWAQRTGQYYSNRRQHDLARITGGTELLHKIISTGRCHHGGVNGPHLKLGSERRGEFVWQMREDGAQQLLIRFQDSRMDEDESPSLIVLPLIPPHYLDPDTGFCGVLDMDMNPALAARLAAAPPLKPQDAALVRPQMEKAFTTRKSSTVPLPEAPETIRTREIKPAPVLRLISGDLKYNPAFFHTYRYYHAARFEKITVPLARLSFDYDGHEIPHESEVDTLEVMENGKLTLIPRDAAMESSARQRLEELGFECIQDSELFSKPRRHKDDYYLMPVDPDGLPPARASQELYFHDDERFIHLTAEIIPWLVEDKGWRVEIAEDYPYRVINDDVEWWADIDEGSGIDWFSFALGLELDGEKINLLPTLMETINKLPDILSDIDDIGQRDELLADIFDEDAVLWHRLDDGRLLPLPGPRLLPIIRILLDLSGIGQRFSRFEDGVLHLSPLEAAGLSGFEESCKDLRWRGHERIKALGSKLREVVRGGLLQIPPPPGLRDILRPYQQEGLNWLTFLRESCLGGVLADDMGLGKTLQTLAFLLLEKQAGHMKQPALIVSPTSVLPNWQAEIHKFAPELSVLRLHGPERKELFYEVGKHDILLTTYPLLVRDKEFWLEQTLHSVILDESQVIKNPRAQVSEVAAKLKADIRLALTGTPVENNLDELWSLFRFLNPGFLGDLKTFRRHFRTPIEKHGDAQAQAFLARRLKPFMLRRTKDQVALELPPKTNITEYVELEGPQRDLYETIRLMMDEKVRKAIADKGLARSRIIVLDALLKLRQACCDPRLVKLASARRVKKSAKLNRLMEMLPELIAEGRRILLFSQFTSMLDLIRPELDSHNIRFVEITGKTRDRETPVRQFQTGDIPLFLISLKAGGTGLNLTAADTVIHYDPWWNPAVENQATDRAHRIGQDKPVFVHRLMVKNSVEEAIEQLKERKEKLASGLFNETAGQKFTLEETDINALFAPL